MYCCYVLLPFMLFCSFCTVCYSTFTCDRCVQAVFVDCVGLDPVTCRHPVPLQMPCSVTWLLLHGRRDLVGDSCEMCGCGSEHWRLAVAGSCLMCLAEEFSVPSACLVPGSRLPVKEVSWSCYSTGVASTLFCHSCVV